MKAIISDRGLSMIISSCEVDPLATLWVFARAHEIKWSDLEAGCRFQYNFASAMIIAVPE